MGDVTDAPDPTIDRASAAPGRDDASGRVRDPAAAPGARAIPAERGVVPGGLDRGGGATSSFAIPADAAPGLPATPMPLRIGGRTFAWGARTYVMGVVNATPDSFSGDGLLASGDAWVEAGLAQASRMVEQGADILDVGGESTRPGHAPVDAAEEIRRVVPVVAAIHVAHPSVPVSVDTVKPEVAAAAIEAGAALVNDVWGVAADDALARLAAERGVPIVLMHNRAEARYTSLLSEIVADLQRAVDRAVRAGVPWESIVVDPGFGFGKAPAHNIALLRGLAVLRVLGRPVLLGTSRKSTLGKVLDLPPEERLEATLATTALAIAAGVDVVRVHDVRPNVRVARMTDAVVRGGPSDAAADGAGSAMGAPADPRSRR
jgi:dihydropteroate synthase